MTERTKKQIKEIKFISFITLSSVSIDSSAFSQEVVSKPKSPIVKSVLKFI